MKDFLSIWTDDVKHVASFLVGVLIEIGVEATPTNDITDFSVFVTFIAFCCLAKSNSKINVLCKTFMGSTSFNKLFTFFVTKDK